MQKVAVALFLAPGENVLFLKRSATSDHPGEWDFPGGGVENEETLQEAVIREVSEETGINFEAVIEDTSLILSRRIAENVDCSTFLVKVSESFIPKLNDEHSGYAWAKASAPPEPLHPGVAVSLKCLVGDELEVARLIASGDLASPFRYENITLFAIRITGTGVAYRQSIEEFVWRDPSIYLNDHFLARCSGLPVIWEHPEKATLNSKEFGDRVVGTVMFAYIVGDEVWAIARIYDDAAISAMANEQLSTSPSVVFRNPRTNTNLQLDNDSNILIEGKPNLLDHIAICINGVWDKGREPDGIENRFAFADSAPAFDFNLSKLERFARGLQLLDIRMSNYFSGRQ